MFLRFWEMHLKSAVLAQDSDSLSTTLTYSTYAAHFRWHAHNKTHLLWALCLLRARPLSCPLSLSSRANVNIMSEFPPLHWNTHNFFLGLEWPAVCLLEICISMKSQSRKKDKNHTLLKEERERVKVVKEERKGGGVQSQWKMKSDLFPQNTDFPMRWQNGKDLCGEKYVQHEQKDKTFL